MKIVDIISNAVSSKDYVAAMDELKKLNLDRDDQEKYSLILKKICGYNEKIYKSPMYVLDHIPNDLFLPILQDAVAMVRDNCTSPEICQFLHQQYGIDGELLKYFNNEAIHIVKMNSLSKEEYNFIGKSYLVQLSNYLGLDNLEENSKSSKKSSTPIIGPEEEHTAIEVDEVNVYSGDDE
jgi:hypothetical protein